MYQNPPSKNPGSATDILYMDIIWGGGGDTYNLSNFKVIFKLMWISCRWYLCWYVRCSISHTSHLRHGELIKESWIVYSIKYQHKNNGVVTIAEYMQCVPHACSRGKAICLFVCLSVHKITRSGALGIWVTSQHNKSIISVEKLPSLYMLSKFHKCYKQCVYWPWLSTLPTAGCMYFCMLALAAALNSIMQIGCTFNVCRVCSRHLTHGVNILQGRRKGLLIGEALAM